MKGMMANMSELLINNGRILTCKSDGPKYGEDMMDLGVIENGFIAIDNGAITEVNNGSGSDYIDKNTIVYDAKGKLIMPGLVDPHTHSIYYGSRENELELKLNGTSYIDILKMGGGILSTVRETRNASKDDLIKKVNQSLDVMLNWGTTTVEVKTGYGLNFKDEIKCLEVLNEIKHPVDIVKTFMGAHAVPEEFQYNKEGYIKLLTDELIPYVAQNKMAEFIDCFCEEGVFTVQESEVILKKGKENNLKVKVHADEITSIGGAELSAKLGAISAEHLVSASDEGIFEMKKANVIPVLLPGTSFYLRLGKYANARKMIKDGMPVAIATDYNPGTCPTESLQSIFIFASMGMKMMPNEIINAATINAAYAIDRGNSIGSIEKGKQADILIMNVPNENYMIYHFGINHVNSVIKKGKIIIKNQTYTIQ